MNELLHNNERGASNTERERALNEGRVQLVERSTKTRLAAQQVGMSYSQGAKEFCCRAKKLGDIASERRTKGEMLATIEQVLAIDENGNSARIESLPAFEGVTFLRQGGQAQIKIRGKIETEKGSDELLRMRTIRNRMLKTAQKNPNFFKSKQSYLVQYAGTYVLDRSLLEDDIRWLSDGKRIGENVPPKRQELFGAYRTLLTSLIGINTPAAEAAFIGKSGSIVGARACLENACRDPNNVKEASKFGALLAVGALLALFAIKDARNKSLSFGTMLLLGAGMLLLKNGSKFNFLGSEQFGRLTRGPLDGKAITKLQNLSRSKPSAYSHLTKWLDKRTQYNAGMVDEGSLPQLTKPIDRNGRVDTRKAVPEDIAKLFVGTSSSDAAYVLKKLRGTARSRDRRVPIEFASANHASNGQTQRDMHLLSTG